MNMITGKQLIYPLLEAINDKLAVTPDESPFLLDPKKDLNGFYSEDELNKLLLKLQNDEKVLVVTQWPMTEVPDYAEDETDFIYKLAVRLTAFRDYYNRMKLEPEYKEYTSRFSIGRRLFGDDDEVARVTYSPTREILINDVFQLGKPDFNRENDLVFQYIFDNPNRTITVKELRENAKVELSKTLHKVVENLGFKGVLKDLFFSISKDSIMFRNPLKKRTLNECGLKNIEILLK